MNFETKIPRVQLQPHPRRIVEAIIFLIGEAEKRDRKLSQYDIVKSLFLADKAHLNRYGRPITFDNYVAMRHGPVPSFAYDMLKPQFDWVRHFKISCPPWTRQEEAGTAKAAFSSIRPADLDVLSESDLDALRGALGTVMSLSFGQLRRVTHEDPAYLQAWQDDAEQQAFPMNYGLLFDTPTPDDEAADDIARASRQC